MEHNYFMGLALEEAKKAYEIGEVPIGAIIVRDNQVIASAFNKRELGRNATHHAELLAIQEACEKLGGWRLIGCPMHVILEPCLMCAGAIINSRLERLIYGARDPKAGAVQSLYHVLEDTRLNHQVEVIEGVLAAESSALLKDFFANLRLKNKS